MNKSKLFKPVKLNLKEAVAIKTLIEMRVFLIDQPAVCEPGEDDEFDVYWVLPHSQVSQISSDHLHEKIREYNYEIDMCHEREPQGLLRIKLTRYRRDSERESYENPLIDCRDCTGFTLRAALLDGLVQIIKEGVID